MPDESLSFALSPELANALLVAACALGYAVVGGLTAGVAGRLFGATKRAGWDEHCAGAALLGGVFWPLAAFFTLAALIANLILPKE